MDMYKPDGTLMDAFAAFPAVYGETWTAVLADFGELALFHGWIDVGYQVYLNNEPGPDRPTPGPSTSPLPCGTSEPWTTTPPSTTQPASGMRCPF